MTQRQALDIVKTGLSVFLTGEPGSGKTHTITEYIRYLKRVKVDVAVTASTGIAATHIGGVTIHSWSGIGIKKTLSKYDVDRIATNERVARRVGKTVVLLIDEVSMLDGGVLESVDAVCRAVKQVEQPFGGIQVVLVGDFFQLPPVSQDREGSALFAFESPAWGRLRPIVCYLSEQHRQADKTFLEILSALRRNAVTPQHCEYLDRRCLTPAPAAASTITKLFSHNLDVNRMNDEELQRISGPAKTFRMVEHGSRPLVEQLRRGCLSPEALTLKVGAAVMFTKNSPKGSFVNGTLGEVVEFEYGRFPVVKTTSGRRIVVEPMEWTIEDGGRALARISQIPLRLAWAMTVHKSQGMSLDAAFVDLRSAFVEGQGYVALSRLKSLSGLFLAGYNQQALKVHPLVLARDGNFRAESQAAAVEFGKISDTELHSMHMNFIRAAGGILQNPKIRQAAHEAIKTYSVPSIRAKYPNAYRSWNEQEINKLLEYQRGGKRIGVIAKLLGRKPGAIRARLEKIAMRRNDTG